MKMVSRVALQNMKYHKSKNILTGVAIFLTTLLLFVIPTVERNLIDVQYAMVNEVYPRWHAYYQSVDEETIADLSVQHDIESYGIRKDVGFFIADDETEALMMYLDENGAKFQQQNLVSGRYPQKENEIALTRPVLNLLGTEGGIGVGNTVTISYQLLRSGKKDYMQQKEFVITGLMEAETDDAGQEEPAVLYVSGEFAQTGLAAEELRSFFLFRIAGDRNATTDEIGEQIREIAGQFGIAEDQIGINTAYLSANYVDPSMLIVTILIMIVVVFAGSVTIYSIYYVSMPQRIREFGKLKALGATKRQLKQIVLREGMLVAVCAVPVGLIVGTLLTKSLLLLLCTRFSKMETGNFSLIQKIIKDGQIDFYHGWIYALAVAVTFLVVFLSLKKPMRMAARVSVIEAMRYEREEKGNTAKRKIRTSISVARLAWDHIFRNKKKSMVTILSLSITGILVMVVASVLACTSPELMTQDDVNGQYMLEPDIENGNKEHPELAWEELQKNNPLSADLKSAIEQLDGVNRVDVFSLVDIGGGIFQEEGFGEDICGLPEEYAEELEAGIIEGAVDYEELKSGEKVVVDNSLLYWYPELQVGDRLKVTVHDGWKNYPKEFEIAAIGDYRGSIRGYEGILMAKEAADRLLTENGNRYFSVMAEEDYEEALCEKLEELCSMDGRLVLTTRKNALELNQAAMAMLNGGCFVFLGILSFICIMSLVNTMINSVHVRKKELGMLQAIGMSQRQLQQLLLLEGMYYTIGTLVVTLGAGSALGYLAFLWAKNAEILRIRVFYYPWETALIVIVVLSVVQIFLAIILSRSVKKVSIIERIRFHE